MNKVTFGLKSVHIAFKGTAQTETIEVTAACGTDGEITITVTAATLLGDASPASVVVPLSTESHGSVTKVASAIVNILNNDADISAVFVASCSGGVITLTARVAAANDATLAIAATVGATGVTVGASTNVTAGATSWGAPVAIPGAVKWTPKPEGQVNTLYADNGIYWKYITNDGYTGDLEMALVPDSVLAEMLGWEVNANGMLVEIADAQPKEFALMGQVEGDDKNRRFVYYSCTAARPSKEHSSKADKVTPATDVLSLTVLPIEVAGKRIVKGTLELSASNAAAYNAFFDAVTVPAA